MIYVGKEITHKAKGKGKIVSILGDKFIIKFDKTGTEHLFKYESLGEWFHEAPDMKPILSLLEEYHFEGFHHYTDFTNFLKIMKEGKLYSREKAQEKGLLLTDGAEGEIIAKTSDSVKSKVRFYYKEKTPTLYQNEGIRHEEDFKVKDGQVQYLAHMPVPVLFLFKKNLIFEPDVCFSNGGCGSSLTKISGKLEEVSAYDWENIFKRGTISASTDALRHELNNKRNAEFLVSNMVDVDKLKAIIFRTKADKKRAEFLLGKNELFQVNVNKFTIGDNPDRKRNCLVDYEVHKDGNNRAGELAFWVDVQKYDHKLIGYFEDGTKKEIPFLNFAARDGDAIFSHAMEDGIERVEYLLNDVVSAVWR